MTVIVVISTYPARGCKIAPDIIMSVYMGRDSVKVTMMDEAWSTFRAGS